MALCKRAQLYWFCYSGLRIHSSRINTYWTLQSWITLKPLNISYFYCFIPCSIKMQNFFWPFVFYQGQIFVFLFIFCGYWAGRTVLQIFSFAIQTCSICLSCDLISFGHIFKINWSTKIGILETVRDRVKGRKFGITKVERVT